jgi:protein MpaA
VAYFYGSGPTTVLFTGGIHGDEASGTYIMQDWAAHLDANAYKLAPGKQVVIVPNLNPDGIAANRRYNMNNVNVDRNFPSSDWISDITLTDGRVLPRGGGATPLSEPETQAIAELTSSLKVRAAISFHSSGALVGANKVADSVAIGSAYARGVGYGTMFYNPESIMGYTLTGEYETWMGEKFGIPAVLIELPTATGRYFSRHLSTLWAMANL